MTNATPPSTRIKLGAGVLAWRNAVFAIFVLNGIELASWVSRIPGVRDDLTLSDADIGILLLFLSAAAVLGLIASPPLLARFGPRRGIVFSLACASLGLVLVGIGASLLQQVPVVALGLAFVGFGNGSVDVMMNVEGTRAEREVRKTQMPLMHAGYSLGTVIGAGIGAAAAALRVDLAWHFTVIAVLVVAGSCIAVRFFPATEVRGGTLGEDGTPSTPAAKMPLTARLRGSLTVWADVTLILIGLVMLGMAFTEGSANDWLALAVVDGHHQTNPVGALVFGIFVAAMTVGRLLGGPVVDRFGRVAAIRVTAAMGVAGLLLFILGGPMWVVVIGTILWGIGCSLGFPLGMSAAAENTDHPAARVSAVAMIGYCAFLVGPPVMGFLGQAFGLLNALYLVLALLLLSAIFAGALRPTGPTKHTRANGQ